MKAIESLLDIYKNAVFQKDVAAFVSIFDEHVRVFDMWEQWSYDGLSAWRAMVNGWFSSLGTNNDVVEFSDIQIHAGNDFASVSAIVKFTAVSDKGEALRYLQNRFTWVIREKNGAWKIIHQHSSGPIDGNTMKVILTR